MLQVSRIVLASLIATVAVTGCVTGEDVSPGDRVAPARELAADGSAGGLTAAPLGDQGPVVLATGQVSPQGLAVDGDALFWTAAPGPGSGNAAIVRLSRAGGDPLAIVRNNDPWGFAVDGAALYWADLDLDAIMVSGKAGGGAKRFADALGTPVLIALDATHVYWVTSEGIVAGAAKRDGVVVKLAAADGLPAGLAVDASHVYFTSGSQLLRVSRGGGAIDKLAGDASFAGNLAVDDEAVYWLDDRARAVRRVSTRGGAPATLAGGAYRPAGVAVGGDHVYFTTQGAGTLERVSRRGGAVEILASGLAGPAELAIGDGAVYWIEQDSGTINGLAL